MASASFSREWLRFLRKPGAARLILALLLPLLLHGAILGFLFWTEPSRGETEQRRLQTQNLIVEAESAVRVLIQEKSGLATFCLTGNGGVAAGGGAGGSVARF